MRKVYQDPPCLDTKDSLFQVGPGAIVPCMSDERPLPQLELRALEEILEFAQSTASSLGEVLLANEICDAKLIARKLRKKLQETDGVTRQ